ALLADLAGEQARSEAAVEGPDPGPGLAEAGVLGGDRQVADDVEDVAPADRVAGHHGDDRLGRPADLGVEVGHVDAPGRRPLLDVAGVTPGPLVPARAEGVGSLAGEDDHPVLEILPGPVEGVRELDHRLGPEGVA